MLLFFILVTQHARFKELLYVYKSASEKSEVFSKRFFQTMGGPIKSPCVTGVRGCASLGHFLELTIDFHFELLLLRLAFFFYVLVEHNL